MGVQKLLPQNLAWASHFTQAQNQAKGLPQMLAPKGTPYSDPIWKTPKGKELGGSQQTKIAPQGGFVHTNFICGGLTLGLQGPP